jgi:hypothetical protein
MLKIKFLKDFPTDETILKWEEDFGCLHIPELVIYKDEKNKTLLIDIEGLDQTLPPLSVFFNNFVTMSNSGEVWISAECYHDFQTRYYLETDTDDFKIDIRKTYSGWDFSSKNVILWKYKLLKSIGASIEYIRFSLSKKNKEYVLFLDRRYKMTDEEMKEFGISDNTVPKNWKGWE